MKNRNIRKDCKCDCGHTKKDHFGNEGFCSKCARTYFYPNIKRQKNKEKKNGKEQ